VADAVSWSWFFGTDRVRVIDSDKAKIDNLIMDLDQKAYSGFFDNSPQGLQDAMDEFALLGLNIENCRLK
jgi:hypothetical protein